MNEHNIDWQKHNIKRVFAPKPKKQEPPIDREVSKIVGKKVMINDPKLVKLAMKWRGNKPVDGREPPDNHLKDERKIKELKELLSKYNSVGIASLEKVRSAQLQQLRRKLADSASMRVVKNSLIERAVAESTDKAGIEKLEEHLTGPNLFLFTNLNPFKLVLLLEQSRVKATA